MCAETSTCLAGCLGCLGLPHYIKAQDHSAQDPSFPLELKEALKHTVLQGNRKLPNCSAPDHNLPLSRTLCGSHFTWGHSQTPPSGLQGIGPIKSTPIGPSVAPGPLHLLLPWIMGRDQLLLTFRSVLNYTWSTTETLLFYIHIIPLTHLYLSHHSKIQGWGYFLGSPSGWDPQSGFSHLRVVRQVSSSSDTRDDY